MASYFASTKISLAVLVALVGHVGLVALALN